MTLLRPPFSRRAFLSRSVAFAWYVAFAALALSPATALRAATPAEPRTLVFFGDSLTFGYGLDDPATESYPALIQKKIDAAHLPWRVVNAGISGETTSAGVRRLDWVLRQHVDVFVLALGANDGLRGTEIGIPRANLQRIIDRVHEKSPSTQIVLAGMMMPPTLGADYTRQFAAMYPELARKNSIPLIPFILDGVAGSATLNQGDQIHPTARGHVVVAENVWKVIQPLLAP